VVLFFFFHITTLTQPITTRLKTISKRQSVVIILMDRVCSEKKKEVVFDSEVSSPGKSVVSKPGRDTPSSSSRLPNC
jgi:hypothetical protein